MEKEFTCFFTGHRFIAKADEPYIREQLKNRITILIEDKGVTSFISGAALGFDTIAAEEVIKLKSQYDYIKIYLYIPCKNQSSKWREADKLKWKELLKSVDEYFFITDSDYVTGCMQKRNRKMADDSKYCIAYLKRKNSGTASTVSYAENNNDIIYYI